MTAENYYNNTNLVPLPPLPSVPNNNVAPLPPLLPVNESAGTNTLIPQPVPTAPNPNEIFSPFETTPPTSVQNTQEIKTFTIRYPGSGVVSPNQQLQLPGVVQEGTGDDVFFSPKTENGVLKGLEITMPWSSGFRVTLTDSQGKPVNFTDGYSGSQKTNSAYISHTSGFGPNTMYDFSFDRPLPNNYVRVQISRDN